MGVAMLPWKTGRVKLQSANEMNFSAFQSWREQYLNAHIDLLDGGETNLYRTLTQLQPKLDQSTIDRKWHRCDLARTWLTRYGFSESYSRHALVCRGVRHALELIFKEVARSNAILWLPGDVYPVYWEQARAIGIEPQRFNTLPKPILPDSGPGSRPEFLLLTNPWKPLGRYLAEKECSALLAWLKTSHNRYLLID